MLRFGEGSVAIQAHRLAYVLAIGPIPAGKCVLHRCDTPACVNPLHLRLGDDADNTADKVARGRVKPPRGEQQGRAKLTDETAMEVYLSPASYDEIAEAYGISDTLVYKVKRRQVWRHIHGGASTSEKITQ